MKEIIKVEYLSKVYASYKGSKEVQALRDCSLHVYEEEFVAIMGPSGSGKTTFLNIVSGLDKATSGKITVNKTVITDLKQEDMTLFRREYMGYIFQDFNLMDSLTIEENIGLPLILNHVDPKIVNEKVDALLEVFQMKEIKGKYPYYISGGQKQRVAAARAIIHQPYVCFADEPTGNLDSKSSRNVMNLLKEMNEQQKTTIVMVTHDPFAASYCKRIIFIKDGEVSFEMNRKGNRKEFFDQILDTMSILNGEQE